MGNTPSAHAVCSVLHRPVEFKAGLGHLHNELSEALLDPQQPLSYNKSDSKEWRLIFCLVTPMRAHYLDGSTFRNSKDGVA